MNDIHLMSFQEVQIVLLKSILEEERRPSIGGQCAEALLQSMLRELKSPPSGEEWKLL